jgi:predicted transcriptional regulator
VNFQILLEMEQSVLRKNAIAGLEHGAKDRIKTKEYRERHAIIIQILGSIDNSGAKGSSRTSIMYKTFLSYTHLKEYLSFFLQKGLIEEFPLEFKNSRNENWYTR